MDGLRLTPRGETVDKTHKRRVTKHITHTPFLTHPPPYCRRTSVEGQRQAMKDNGKPDSLAAFVEEMSTLNHRQAMKVNGKPDSLAAFVEDDVKVESQGGPLTRHVQNQIQLHLACSSGDTSINPLPSLPPQTSIRTTAVADERQFPRTRPPTPPTDVSGSDLDDMEIGGLSRVPVEVTPVMVHRIKDVEPQASSLSSSEKAVIYEMKK